MSLLDWVIALAVAAFGLLLLALYALGRAVGFRYLLAMILHQENRT